MNPRADMRFLAPSLCAILGLRPPRESEKEASEDFCEILTPTKSVLVVVFDGFGIATMERHHDNYPNLDLLVERNFVKIRAVQPPKTPVNFATMGTGASQENHGIDQKTDPLKIETIFQVLDEGGMTSCVAGRQTGSPANLFSRMVTYPEIAHTNKDAEVLALVMGRLDESSPDLTLVQFLDIDNAGHKSGPFGVESSRAVRNTDLKLGSLIRGFAGRASIVVLADHGQHEVVGEDGTCRGKHDGSSEEDFVVPLAWCNEDDLISVARDVEQVWE
jgi:predicted AlkP superfamily pyrophosphatase or phosphodiesterase